MSLMSHDCISCPWALLDIVAKFILNSPLKKKKQAGLGRFQLQLLGTQKAGLRHLHCLCVYNPDPFHRFHYFCLLAIFFAF